MEPLIALLAVTAGVFAVNRIWLHRPRGFELALRAGVGVMFTMTGVSHFIGMRSDLIAMVPEWLPFPDLLVTVTGILEVAAAAAMLHRRLSVLAAAGLTLLLVVMFPANIALALSGDPIPWWDELVPRTIMQLVFLAATITVVVLARRPIDSQRRSLPLLTRG